MRNCERLHPARATQGDADTRRLERVAELASHVVQLGEGLPPVWKIGSTLLGGKTFRAALDAFTGEQDAKANDEQG